MKIEEAEKIFRKRWDEWTIEEIEQFVRAIEPSQLVEGVVPLILKWACEYPQWLSTECKAIMFEMMIGKKEEKK